MNEHQQATARACLAAAEEGSMTLPQIVQALSEAGIERYVVDFQRGATTYYLHSGDALELGMHSVVTPVASELNEELLTSAIREAQQLVPGYTYRGFCEKAATAGCVGYLVSISGHRALYFARTAQTHSEEFPPAKQL